MMSSPLAHFQTGKSILDTHTFSLVMRTFIHEALAQRYMLRYPPATCVALQPRLAWG